MPTTTRKSTAKPAAAGKSTAKSAAARKSTAKSAAARKSTAKPAAARKSTAKPAADKKASGKARTTRKATTRRVSSTASGSHAGTTAGGVSLAEGPRALDAAAATEAKLRRKLKKHSKAVDAVHADLKARYHELSEMKAHLKTAKKSRKRAGKNL
jgi:hypothetical protein